MLPLIHGLAVSRQTGTAWRFTVSLHEAAYA